MGTSAYTPAEFTPAEANAELAADYARIAERCRHLEEMFVVSDQTMADQAKLIGELTGSIRIVRDHRDDLMQELTGARVIIEARDNRITQLDLELDRQIEEAAELRGALGRAQDRALTATEAAEEYRAELKRALEGIAALAHSTLGSD